MWWTSPLRTRLKQLIIYMGIYASLIKELRPLQRSGLNGMPAKLWFLKRLFQSMNWSRPKSKSLYHDMSPWYITALWLIVWVCAFHSMNWTKAGPDGVEAVAPGVTRPVAWENVCLLFFVYFCLNFLCGNVDISDIWGASTY